MVILFYFKKKKKKYALLLEPVDYGMKYPTPKKRNIPLELVDYGLKNDSITFGPQNLWEGPFLINLNFFICVITCSYL